MTVHEQNAISLKIDELLPHRFPFLLVDGVIRFDDESIATFKKLAGDEPYFEGHFPGLPVMPGVLQIEAMAQSAGLLLALNKRIGISDLGVLARVRKAAFRRMVYPGNRLEMSVSLLRSKGGIFRFLGVVTVDGLVASEADFTIALRSDMGGFLKV
jgi:3-hydroxyacyl-[acyl-carrier-protein] dehydratase